jgi:uncharacterized surface protein with fasciclin (FAS1) repeats
MKNLFKLSLIVFLLVFATSCSDDDSGDVNPIADATIAAFVQNNGDYSSLLAALERAGLVETLNGSTEYTVFAPNNAAFAAFLNANGFASLDDVPVDLLTNILLNHVVAGTNNSRDLNTGYINSLASFGTTTSNLSLYIDTSAGVRINNVSSVTTPDVAVSNGVIHAVDTVIGIPTIVTQATANPDFSILVEALIAASNSNIDYVALLSGTASSPFTVFAPTNTAFEELLTELGISSLDEIDTATLTATLNTHVIAGANVRAEDLVDGTVSTLGDDIVIDATNATITDQNGRVSGIIVTNVQAANGVVHAIDKVLLPQ